MTGYLVPLFLVAALAGGLLAWVNELVEDGKAPRPVVLLLVAGLVIAARRDELLEKAKQRVRRNGPPA
ncbi:hypothetical protein [Pimelobacter sp. 30-1]|uniref:hypothetical protein n=1 Tax=Pimelobacter sp. 30-1 TaxID=2004991 RepID=UPI001C04ADC1|nr:hypothetical protein [Pimelobacter sp. 30-1]MBU2693579.1 hypothetical protein [Pimelobacter sp. 30-1]